MAPAIADSCGGLQIELLGPVESRVAGRQVALGGQRPRALFAVLALRPSRVVTNEQLVDELWGDNPPGRARDSVQMHVSRLRKALTEAGAGGDRLVSQAGGYLLNVRPGERDIDRWQQALGHARRARKSGELEVARAGIEDALGVWRGEPLGGVTSSSVLAGERARLEEERLGAIVEGIELDLELGRHGEPLGQLEALVVAHPFQERLVELQMLALYRCGRQADALEAFHAARRRFVEELGIEPRQPLRRLHEDILKDADDPSLLGRFDEPGSRELPSGVVTFVLTDVEESTRLWEADHEAMAAAMEFHDELTASTVEAHAGRVLKARGEGDATLSVFARASDAVRGAAELQVALAAASWPGGHELLVRIALHTGEAYERDGDYFGPALNRAARLRTLARGGATVVSQATAEIVQDRLAPGLQLVDVGRHELRGLSRPERVFELRTGAEEPAREPGRVRLALPRPLRARSGAPFVGRTGELARLRELWQQTSAASRTVFVAGEPGIGKTRLAAELAGALHADGALVLYGRCDEGLAVPYQPFVEALRPYAEAIGLDHVRAQLGRRGPDLAWLLPELDALGEPLRADPETERFRLFEAVTALAEMATREQRALLVLDDLHWGAGSTLLLLRHLIRTERPLRLLILGTYREAELDLGHPLAQLLADPQGDPSAAAVMLGGLDELGIGELLEAAAGPGLDERASGLVTALRSATGGNPFFIGEVLAHLAESGAIYREGERWTAADELDVPARLRHLIGHRVGRLSAPTRRALAAAAVAGPTCTLGLLEHVLDEERELIDALEQAVAAGLLIDAGAAGYAFAHALVRQTIYHGLGSARRVRLHRRVGEALEALVPVDAYLDALANHFAQAAPDGQAAKAADYALAAGRSATARVGHEQAAAHYHRGLEALARAQPPEHQRRCELLLELGDVHWTLGETELARDSCLRAAELAERLRDPGRLARAALIFTGPPRMHLSGPVTESGLNLLERALTALGDDESPLRARVMSRLAVALAYLPRHRERTRTLASEALAMARRIGEPAALAEVLASTHWATWGPDNVEERLAINRELARSAGELGDGALAAYAHARAASELLELGDTAASGRELGQLERLAEAMQQRYQRWHVANLRAVRAYLEARLEECEAHARDGLTQGQRWNEDSSRGAFAFQMLLVRWEQGRPHDALELAERLAEQYAQVPGVRILLARAYAELERDDDAREELDLVARGDFADLPRDAVWLMMIDGLSQVAARLGDTRRAERLYELLLPYADRCVVGFTAICFGSASWPLGLLATTLSRFDDAERHFERALAMNARIDSRLYVAQTQHDYARMLLLRCRPGDRERAQKLLDVALATADEHGLNALADRARQLGLRRV